MLGSGSARLVLGTLLVVSLMVLVVALAGCATPQTQPAADPQPTAEQAEPSEVILASTTSTEDSGLFDALVPAFEAANPEFRLSVVAVGTGQALEIGRNKDADVLLVHAKEDELEFVADGYGESRLDVMYNDFVILGPSADPAGVRGGRDAAAALTAIAAGEHAFVSRGDDSGTHRKEMRIWEAAGTTPEGDWYRSVGKGMGETLTMTSELLGYTLSDRGTYLAMRDDLDLEVLVEGDEVLFNPYGVLVVTDATNIEGARAFSEWIVSDAAQELIRTFGVETYGEPLFVPNAQ